MAHDIFVSYAHIDDQPPEEVEVGWVTHFIKELNKVLASKLGRTPDVWMDYLLLENAIVDEELYEKVRDSRTIVLFMSPSYLKSKWCKSEVGDFLKHNYAHKNKESVFIVAVEDTRREDWHPRLQKLTPLFFYQKSNKGVVHRLGYPKPPLDSENPYWKQINELAHLIKLQLELTDTLTSPAIPSSINRLPSAGVVVETQADQTKTPIVWIAQPTADLQTHWDALAASIRQRGGEILPLGHSTYPQADIDKFHQAIEQDLTRSNLFVQLLSTQTGGDQFARFLQLQALAARMHNTKTNKPLLQWRESNIDLQKIGDYEYRQLLQGTIACGFEQFRQQVLDQLGKLINPVPKKIIEKPQENSLTLCITAGQKDSDLADKIAEIIAGLQHSPVPVPPVPEEGQSVQEYNEGLRSLLSEVDGIILAHSKENTMWLSSQYARVRKTLASRPNPWGTLVDGPPAERPKISLFMDPGLMYLDCRAGLHPGPIEGFIDKLQGEN
jgi:hypothetical protein